MNDGHHLLCCTFHPFCAAGEGVEKLLSDDLLASLRAFYISKYPDSPLRFPWETERRCPLMSSYAYFVPYVVVGGRRITPPREPQLHKAAGDAIIQVMHGGRLHVGVADAIIVHDQSSIEGGHKKTTLIHVLWFQRYEAEWTRVWEP